MTLSGAGNRYRADPEIAIAMILKSHGQSATQILRKLDRRFPHGAGRLDSNWLEDEASAQLSVLGDFPDFSGVGDGPSGEFGVRLLLGSKLQTC